MKKLVKMIPVVALSLLPLTSQAEKPEAPKAKEIAAQYTKSVATGVLIGQAVSSSLGNGLVDITPVARSVAARMTLGYTLPDAEFKKPILEVVDCGLHMQGWYFLGLAFSAGVSGMAYVASLGALASCFMGENTAQSISEYYPDPMTSN